MSTGWLVNDTLTCIPGTKTLWHDLLDWIPGLIDMTNGRTDFAQLPSFIEKAAARGAPDFIIRNATFFRPLKIPSFTISLVQDIYDGPLRQVQGETIAASDIVVCNSRYTYSEYKDLIADRPCEIIPIGTDFDFFTSLDKEACRRELGIPENAVLFVGSSLNYPKGFDVVLSLIMNTDYDFVLVMKDDFGIKHPRVKVYNKVPHEMLRKIYSACSLLICPSRQETLHLSGIEAAACGLPLVTTNVGAYHSRENGEWGIRALKEDFASAIGTILNSPHDYSPREYFLKEGFDRMSCRNKWISIIP